MKRVVFGLVAIIVLIAGNSVWHNSEHGGKNLFVKIQEDEKIEMKKSDNGHVTKYKYSVIGFDEKGKSQEIKLTAQYSLKHYDYLKVVTNKKKGVLSWKEVKKQEIPKNPLFELEKA